MRGRRTKAPETTPPPPDQAALERRCKLLEFELEEHTTLYAQAVDVIAELEAKQSQAEEQARAIANANVRAALLMEEIETREQALAEQTAKAEALLEEVAEKNAQLDSANQRLEVSYDALTKEQAMQEIELKRMEIELQTAKAVQQMLIPAEPPRNIPGLELATSYTPAGETGGDWLGFLHNPHNRELSILIGDVTGHGVGPALIVAGAFSVVSTIDTMRAIINGVGADALNAVQSQVDAQLRKRILDSIADPRSLLQILDAVIQRMGKQEMLMTFFASVYDYDKRTLRFANAGHCLPILIGEKEVKSASRSSRRVPARQLVARGNQLGMASAGSTIREIRTQQLEPGDLLVYYTDGLIENSNHEGQQCDARRLTAWLSELWYQPVDQIRDALLERSNQFLAGQQPDDDTAFIVARVTA